MGRKNRFSRFSERKNFKWILITGSGLVVACFGFLVAVGAVLLYASYRPIRTDESAAGSEPPGEESAQDQPAVPFAAAQPHQTQVLSPERPRVSDEFGVSGEISGDEFDAAGPFSMVSWDLDPAMLQALENGYQVESLAYSLENDLGSKRAGTLSFPASGPDSRVAVLIDNQYLGELAVAPQDGVLTVSAFVGAGNPDSPSPDQGQGKATVQYLVVNTKETGRSPAGGVYSVSALEPSEFTTCGVAHWSAHCLVNSSRSIFVFWSNDFPEAYKNKDVLLAEDVIRMVAYITELFSSWGLAAGAPTANSPVYLVISASSTAPLYSPYNGSVYIPWDVAASASDPSSSPTLAHELFHWLEDENYAMAAAFYSGSASWWLEMSAELATFWGWGSPALEHNLTFYGGTTTSENILGFQASPFEWDGGAEQARYIQALAFYTAVCDGAGCALSREGFSSAIDAGTYPFDDAEVRSRYEKNSDDFARYLLGYSPLFSFAGALIPPSAKTGIGYGDYLLIRASPAGRSPIEFGQADAQFSRVEGAVDVSAPIHKGGVYPLWVGNGDTHPMGNNTRPGLPGVLEIKPGPAFWIKLGDETPTFYEAGTGLTVGPISKALGYSRVRVAASAPDADAIFQAQLRLADFSGDWYVTHKNEQELKNTCPDEAGESGYSAEGLILWVVGLGAYFKDPTVADGSHYIWKADEALPEKIAMESDITVSVDSVELDYKITIAKSDSTSMAAGPPAAPGGLWGLFAAGALPLLGGALVDPKRKRVWLLSGILLGSALLLTGCVGFGMDFYGTISGKYTATRLEYLGEEKAPDPRVHWQITEGKASVDLDMTVITVTDDITGGESRDEKQCVASYEAAFEGFIGEEGLLSSQEP